MPLPNSNSLLAKGSIQGIQLINEMIQRLDQPKRQIELSLWIIDIAKHEADRLGTDWKSSTTNKKMVCIFMLQPRLVKEKSLLNDSLGKNPFKPVDPQTQAAIDLLYTYINGENRQ